MITFKKNSLPDLSNYYRDELSPFLKTLSVEEWNEARRMSSGGPAEHMNMECSRFRHMDLRGVNLQNAILSDADFRGTDLRGANLKGASLNGVSFELANLEGADLSGARLYAADFNHASIRNLDLRRIHESSYKSHLYIYQATSLSGVRLDLGKEVTLTGDWHHAGLVNSFPAGPDSRSPIMVYGIEESPHYIIHHNDFVGTVDEFLARTKGSLASEQIKYIADSIEVVTRSWVKP